MTDDIQSDAREVDAPTLLRSAARLVERALIKLDMRKTVCKECSDEHYSSPEHARVYHQFTDTPYKLERAAAVLDGDPEKMRGTNAKAAVSRTLAQTRRGKR